MKHKILLLAITLLLVILIAGNLISLKSKQDDVIELGAILILSGSGASTGTMIKQGIDLAVSEINIESINGKKIKVNYQDNPGDDKNLAISALHQFKNQGIELIIGTTWSGSALAVAPVACNNNMLLVAPGIGLKEFEQECDYLFNAWMADEDVSNLLGEKIYGDGHKQLAILGSQQAWEIIQANSVKKGFIEAGGEVVAYELALADQKDFKTEILKIKQSKPDAIFIQYIYQDIISKQLKQANLNIPIYVELIDSTRVKNADGALEGTIATSQISPTTEFVNKFELAYGKLPDVGADNGYDAVMLIANAIKETKSTDATVLKDYLKTIITYNGASGNLTFNEYGGVSKDISFIKVINGNIVPLVN